jgi:hypothetical protein
MSSERLAWTVTNLDHVLEVGLLMGAFLLLLIAAATIYQPVDEVALA